MDISKLSLIELKAMAFDTLTQIEGLQRDLKTLNQAIQQKSQEPKEAPIKGEVVKK